MTRSFEAIFESIVACKDDRAAFEQAIARVHQVRTLELRLLHHLEARALRLREKIEPELKDAAQFVDRELGARTAAR